jgi:hypothetical protein
VVSGREDFDTFPSGNAALYSVVAGEDDRATVFLAGFGEGARLDAVAGVRERRV